MAEIGKDIQKAKAILEAGELVGMPTETVYGLAANAFDTLAATKVFETKNRPAFDPLIVHTYAIDKVKELVISIPEKALVLAEAIWPGPLTLLLPRKSVIPDIVTSGLDTVAIRIPQQPLTQQLLQALDFPLVAPSANPFGYVSPTTAQHVDAQLGSKISYILDGGPCQVGLESTIVGFDGETPIIHRLGGIPKETIEKLIGPVEIQAHSSSNPKAPGMLEAHYSPGKKVILGSYDELKAYNKKTGDAAITFSSPMPDIDASRNFILSKDGSINSAAQHLFSALRAMDQPEVQTIYAELAPPQGLGLAINDRLKRAAAEK